MQDLHGSSDCQDVGPNGQSIPRGAQQDDAHADAGGYPQADLAEISRTLAVLHTQELVELRAFRPIPGTDENEIRRGYFDTEHREALAHQAARLNAEGFAVYVTMNPIDPDLKSRARNHLQRAGKCTQDKDVTRRTRLLIDVDPQRKPSGRSATDAEMVAAQVVASEIQCYLREAGWPEGVRADSGNGCHLIYAVDLPNDEESTKLFKRVLTGLSKLFDTTSIKVDQSVANASRLIRLHGVVTNKGRHTLETPHRLSRLHSNHQPGQVLVPVPLEMLDAIAAHAAKDEPPPSPQDDPDGFRTSSIGRAWTPAQLTEYLTKHGLKPKGPQDYSNGKWVMRWQLGHCPFNPEHTHTSAAVFMTADGMIGFRCLHNSCEGKCWKDVRELYDGPRETRYGALYPNWPPLESYYSESPAPEENAEPAADQTSGDTDDRSSGVQQEDSPQKQEADSGEIRFEAQRDAIMADDTGNATVLANITRGNLRYIYELDQWIRWNGKRWIVDGGGTRLEKDILRMAEFWHEQAEQEYVKLTDIDPKKDGAAYKKQLQTARELADWYVTCRSQRCKAATIKKAQVHEAIALSAAKLDTHPHLLGVGNGVVDLRTGELLSNSRDLLITKFCTVDYDPTAKAPRFERFIAEVSGLPGTGPDEWVRRPKVADYIQHMLGYCVTGEFREHKAFFCWGVGGNGKGVLLIEVAGKILGGYACTTAAGLLTQRAAPNPDAPSPAIRSLAGVRLALVNELQEGDRLNLAMFKSLTGDAEQTARGLHEGLFQFTATHKLAILTNDKPELAKVDDATKGRIHLVPFERQWNRPGTTDRNPLFPDADPMLAQTLKAEWPGILAWLVRGAMAYYRDGLKPCQDVIGATQEYIRENDSFATWFEMCQRCAPEEGVTPSDAYRNYLDWCEHEGRKAGVAGKTQRTFSNAMGKKQVPEKRTNRARLYGLELPSIDDT